MNDWRPFDYLTLTTLPPMPGAPKVIMTYAFVESDGGRTHIEIRVGKPKQKDEAFFRQFGPLLLQTLTSELGALRLMLEAGERPPPAVEEPTPPASAKRFITEPVRPR